MNSKKFSAQIWNEATFMKPFKKWYCQRYELNPDLRFKQPHYTNDKNTSWYQQALGSSRFFINFRDHVQLHVRLIVKKPEKYFWWAFFVKNEKLRHRHRKLKILHKRQQKQLNILLHVPWCDIHFMSEWAMWEQGRKSSRGSTGRKLGNVLLPAYSSQTPLPGLDPLEISLLLWTCPSQSPTALIERK